MAARLPLLGVAIVALTLRSSPAAQAPQTSGSLTDLRGIKVGHHTLTTRPTGCTVVLIEDGAVAGVDVRGAAPGTRETDLLNPVNSVQQIHAIVLAGGSAFGLDTASGVMRYLDEKNIGFKFDLWKDTVGTINIPIVPAAILIDLGVGGSPKIRPDAECGYRAAAAAGTGPIAEGNVGAGAGATIGKLAGAGRAMKGGLGTASVTLPDGVIVAALVAVNAAGDVIDPETGQVVAGVRTPDGRGLADARRLLRSGEAMRSSPAGNTTIGVVATNATLSKTQATKIAQMAQDGYARAIVPAHTLGDGDTVFAIATGEKAGEPNLTRIGAIAAEVVSQAILRAVRQAEGIAGYPAARDLVR
jgi:L-aminopeptidase/D-esterase-like protein